jgi:hypothetical protein
LNEYKKEVDNTAIALSKAEKKLAAVVPFNTYESSMDYFGITTEEAKNLLENQVNSATYINARRVQAATVGVTAPVFMDELKAAFEEQKDVKLRRLSMTPERYIQLSYSFQKITDEEEMKDFAYISTHSDVRTYYMSSNTGLVIAEKLDSICRPKVDVTVQSASRTKIENPLKIELTSKGWWQLLLLLSLTPFLVVTLLALIKLLGLLIQH